MFKVCPLRIISITSADRILLSKYDKTENTHDHLVIGAVNKTKQQYDRDNGVLGGNFRLGGCQEAPFKKRFDLRFE